STAEVESALVAHPAVAEAAVVGATDPTTGQGNVAFVITNTTTNPHPTPDQLITHRKTQGAQELSPLARPRDNHIVPELPKTRSG
ncbi:AMP-binding enzyme, partial [Nocardia farcinica]|uniref:AMP-binding enzyme n=1 Tax=Nocardia farcinica TaxID=37329 RepID=UPI003CC7D0A6